METGFLFWWGWKSDGNPDEYMVKISCPQITNKGFNLNLRLKIKFRLNQPLSTAFKSVFKINFHRAGFHKKANWRNCIRDWIRLHERITNEEKANSE